MSNIWRNFLEFLTSEEMCKMLKVKDSYLRNLRHQKRIPYRKIGKLVRYEKSAIEKWIESGKSAETTTYLPEEIM